MHDIEDFILDFMTAAERAEELSYYFNQMDKAQFMEFLGSVPRTVEGGIFHDFGAEIIVNWFNPELAQTLVTNLDLNHDGLPINAGETDQGSIEDDDDNFWQNHIDSIFSNSPPDNSTNEPAKPTPPLDNEEQEEEAHSSGGSCFVATAAFRNPYHPDVVFLRSFRDEFLCKFFLGRVFITIYWITGPVLAVPVRNSDLLAAFSRYCLRVIIRLISFSWRKVDRQ